MHSKNLTRFQPTYIAYSSRHQKIASQHPSENIRLHHLSHFLLFACRFSCWCVLFIVILCPAETPHCIIPQFFDCPYQRAQNTCAPRRMSRYNDYRRYTRSSDSSSLVSSGCSYLPHYSASLPASREQGAPCVAADKSNKAILLSMRGDVCVVS